jgi:hypothetical protein
MADHDSISMLIPWYANGTLSPEERDSVENHLERCSECRDLLEQARAMEPLGQVEPDELLEHVQAQHLELFATDRRSMQPEVAAWVGEHVESCAVCGDAVRILERSAGESIDEAQPQEYRVRYATEKPSFWTLLGKTILHPAAAAAYLVIIALMIPAYRMIVDRPTVEQRLDGARNWGGAVDLEVLSSALRGDESAVVLNVGAEQPVVPLGVEFEIPVEITPTTPIVFEVSSEADAVVWSEEIEAANVERNLNHSGIVTLLLPASSFPPGSYRLKVSRSDRPGSRALLEAPFRIAGTEP